MNTPPNLVILIDVDRPTIEGAQREFHHLAGEMARAGAGATVVKDTVEGGVYMGAAAELRTTDSSRLRYFTHTGYQESLEGQS